MPHSDPVPARDNVPFEGGEISIYVKLESSITHEIKIGMKGSTKYKISRTLLRCPPRSCMQEFYMEKLGDPDYVKERRKEIRAFHNISSRDPRVSWTQPNVSIFAWMDSIILTYFFRYS